MNSAASSSTANWCPRGRPGQRADSGNKVISGPHAVTDIGPSGRPASGHRPGRHPARQPGSLQQLADLCMGGRGYLYGLAAAGQLGVEHAIDLLAGQLRRTLQLLGMTRIAVLRQRGDEV
jgi:hypothetical protein